MNRSALKPIFVSLGVFGVVFAGVAFYLVNASQKTITTQNVSEQQVSSSSPLDPYKKTDLPVSKQVVGGDLKVVGSANIVDGLTSSSVTITPLATASRLKAGQLYSDNSHSLLYFDGKSSMDISGLKNVRGDVNELGTTVQELLSSQPAAGVVTLQGQSGDVVLTGGDGVAIEGTKVSNTGVVTIQGKSGNVIFSAGEGVSILGTTIYNDGVTSLGTMTGNVELGDGLGMSGGMLVNTGVTHLVSGSSDIVLTDDGTGTYTIGYAGSGVGGTVALGSNFAQSDTSTNPSIYINKTGTGNLIQLSTGSSPVDRFVVDQAGAIISGSISFNQITSMPSMVNSIGGLGGTVSLGNGLAINGGSIVATTAVSNLIGTANQVSVTGSGSLTLSLPQDIATSSTPTFQGLNLTSALTVANGGTGATNAAGARNNLGAAKNGANSDITSLTGLTSALSVSQGGTGANSFATNSLITGQGTGSLGTLSTTSAGQCLVTGSGGSLGFQSCPGTAVVTGVNGASGALTLTGVDPASIVTSGTAVTIQDASATVKGLASFNGSNFSVSNGAVNTIQDIGTGATPHFDGLTLTSALSVAQGGTGVGSLAANSLLVGQGTAAVGTLGTTTANQCLITGSGGSLGFAACPGSTGVSSFNGLNGAVALATTSASSLLTTGNTITIQDATASIKGLASFNSTNLVVTSGAVNTIQDININASPTFASLSLTSALSVVNGGTGTTSLTANGVLIGNGTGAVSTVNASGASQCLVSASDGSLSFVACPGSGGVTSFNSLTGAVTFNTISGGSLTTLGNAITLNDATSSVKGLASFNNTNFNVSAGAVNTAQNINTGATPAFAGLTLSSALGLTSGGTGASNSTAARTNLGAAARGANSDITSLTNVDTIASTSGLTVGSSGQALTLQGSSVAITSTSGSFTSALSFVTPSANVTYRLQSAAAGTYDVCTTVGNCVGTGGSVNTAGGTIGRISRFVSGSAIGDSIMTDDGSTVSIAGALSVNNITPTAAAIIGATTQSMTLQGSTTTISASNGGFTNTLQFNTPSGTNKTIQIPNASGTVAVSATGPLVLGADGNLTCPSCLTTGGGGGTGGVVSINDASGALTINAAMASSITTAGTTITINDASSSVKGLASFNSTNFSVTSGAVNTIQNISTSATPTFAGLNLSTPLAVGSGGTGQTTFAANALLVGNGSGGLSTVSASGASECLASQVDGSLEFVPCPGTSVVNFLNGLNGTITIEAASPSSITTAGTTITINDASSSVKGLASFNSTNFSVTSGAVNTIQNINTSATPTFAGLNLTAALSLANGGTGATSAAAARTNLAAAQRGANSDITALSGLTTALSVSQGGTGTTSLTANGVVIGNGTGAVSTVNSSGANQCLVSAGDGSLSFSACPGDGGVTSFNTLTGGITLTALSPASLSTSGNIITINDASSSVKGLASFNGGNFSVANGAVNTVQNIATTSTPTFGGLTLTSALGVASGGTGASSFATNGLLVGQGTAALGTVGTSSAGQCLVSGTGGSLSFAACPGSNGVATLNTLSGAITIATADALSLSTSGNTITINDASSSVKGLASFNSTNLSVTNGAVNTVQNISATAAPTFAGLTLSSALTVPNGGTGVATLTADRVLLGNGTSGIATSNVATNGYCLRGNATGAPTFQACPVGGNISSGTAQTSGAITMFDTTTNQVTNSVISQLGSAVTVAGTLSATSLAGTGSGITSLNASNLSSGTVDNARLTTGVTLQGNTFNGSSQLLKLDIGGQASLDGQCLKSTATGTAFAACSAIDTSTLANRQLSNLQNVAINDILLPGVGNSIDIGSSTLAFKSLYLGSNISAAGTVNGLTLGSGAVTASGALSVSSGGTNQSLTLASTGTGNLILNKNSGNIVLTGFDCSGLTNIGKLTTNASGIVSCSNDVSNTIGAIDTITKSANGAGLSGTQIILQTADASSPGLVSTGDQTFSGTKTFRSTATNALTVQNATGLATTFAVNTTNGLVGIGAVPSAANSSKLQVAGGISLTGGLYASQSGMYVSYDGTNSSQVLYGNGSLVTLNNVTIASSSGVKIGNAQGVLYAGSGGTLQTLSVTGASGKCLGYDGTNFLWSGCSGSGGGSTGYNNGGDAYNTNPGSATSRYSQSYDATITNPVIGLTGPQVLDIITNNKSRIRIQDNGDVAVQSNGSETSSKFSVRTLNEGNVEQYISTLVVDTASDLGGRVGIGLKVATTPQVTLDIGGGRNDYGGSGIQVRASAAPGLSTAGSQGEGTASTGRIYYDHTLRKFRVSENGNSWSDLVVGGGGNPFLIGGNAQNGVAAILGTTDNSALNIRQNNSDRIVMDQGGNIALTAAAGYSVNIAGATTQSGVALNVNGRILATSYASGGYVGSDIGACNSNQAMNGMRVVSGLVVAGICAVNNSDLAEAYNSSDTLEPGELVMAAGTAATSVNRATNASEGALMGIVSTEPGKLLGTEQVPDGYPVALSGRVPTKVNTEGGAIAVGDKITISSVAGVGKKATAAGMVVGTAVEAFNGSGTGSIEVFVNLMYYNPVDGDNLQAQVGTFGDLNVSGEATIGTLTVTGEAHFNGNIVVNGHIITGGTTPTAVAQAAGGAGSTVVVSGNDTAGTITFTAGAGAVPTDHLLQLTFTQSFGKTPRVIVSAQDAASVRAMAFPSNKSTTGFGLSTSEALVPGAVYTFDYFVVE